MKSKLNELRLDAGIARIENQQWLCVLDKETGMMIDPLIGLEKFAELIVRECAACCGSQADMRNIRKRFGLSVESNVKYLGPEKSGSVNSQYEREYNLPGKGNK